MPGWRIRQMAATCLKDSHFYARVVVRISNGDADRVCSNNRLERSRGVASLSSKAVVREWRQWVAKRLSEANGHCGR